MYAILKLLQKLKDSSIIEEKKVSKVSCFDTITFKLRDMQNNQKKNCSLNETAYPITKNVSRSVTVSTCHHRRSPIKRRTKYTLQIF